MAGREVATKQLQGPTSGCVVTGNFYIICLSNCPKFERGRLSALSCSAFYRFSKIFVGILCPFVHNAVNDIIRLATPYFH